MAVDGDGALSDWVSRIGWNIECLDMCLEDNGFRADFTGSSLQVLEWELLDDQNGMDDADWQDMVDGAVGYLGEVLMRLAGGRWGWRGREPVVHADEAVGLDPIFPKRHVYRAICGASERKLFDVYVTWEEAVARHRAADPLWVPMKEYTPDVDPYQMSAENAACIAKWVNERREGFVRWCETYGGGATWDFGPASLDVLEGMLPTLVPTLRDLRDPARRDFIDGAAWYLGEVILRAGGGTWVYRGEDLEDYYAGEPYVHTAGPDGEPVIPVVELAAFIIERTPGMLRQEYARWTGE